MARAKNVGFLIGRRGRSIVSSADRVAALLVIGLALSCSPKGGSTPMASGEAPKGPLGPEEAAKYVLGLINRDRADHGLEPLEWDPVAAEAARRHAEDMVRHGFTAHWGTDGSVPEQRYSEAGGTDLVRENAACFFDGKSRELDPDPVFEPDELEKIESAFINEVPPNDGHRRNILEPTHSRGGVGLAKPLGLRQVCMAQELVGDFGDYEELPERARANSTVRVAGEVREPVKFGGVGVKRLPVPAARAVADLNQTSSYPVPPPDTMYFPEGFQTPKPVKFDGKRFEIEVPLGAPGLYEISVWGQFPQAAPNQLSMTSLRTLRVE